MLTPEIESLKVAIVSGIRFKSDDCRKAVLKNSDLFIRQKLLRSLAKYNAQQRRSLLNIFRRPMHLREYVQFLLANDYDELVDLVSEGIAQALQFTRTVRDQLVSGAPPGHENIEIEGRETSKRIKKISVILTAIFGSVITLLNKDEFWMLIQRIAGNLN